MIKAVNFTVFTILTDADQDFAPGVSHLPARPLRMKISKTFFVNKFRTVH